ncbi:MAG: tRNA (5-methylaminomethyl-2-thiouridine)(34)-methyltransferase MnmD [Balneolaceae bacterium]|nr:tRNA (5-methylaminomethyl-2-thiouridine)(34)-methyltransferase MnmD [Balneolaceae bacterium]
MTQTDDSSRNSNAELHTTRDGSHTLYSQQFGQHYHNPNGAVAESRHNFFRKNRLLDRLTKDESITILEVGFGTGLNFLLLLDEYLNSGSDARIDFYSIEGFPVDAKTARSFNYRGFLDHSNLFDYLPVIFRDSEPGMNHFELHPNVNLHLFIGMFEEFNPKRLNADFIFHDPFSPDVNDELWTGDVFKKLAGWCNPNAVLSTYSAASKARGAMAWAGWHVAREQGALGKREMTIASLKTEKLVHLERVNEERLAHRYEIGDF